MLGFIRAARFYRIGLRSLSSTPQLQPLRRDIDITFIRHGEGTHNTAARQHPELGDDIYLLKEHTDPALTPCGHQQALSLIPYFEENPPDRAYVSPSKRCLQTATNALKSPYGHLVPLFASETIREFPLGLQTCNKRSPRSELQQPFSNVCFETLYGDHDLIWRNDRKETIAELDERIEQFWQHMHAVLSTDSSLYHIAIFSHSSFISKVLFDVIPEGRDAELDHCAPYCISYQLSG